MSETSAPLRTPMKNSGVQDKHFYVLTCLLVLVLTSPIIALILIAFSGSGESLEHLARTILPQATSITLQLLIGVGIFVAIIGTLTAWLVTFFEFPGRRIAQYLLILPLAVPTYISAYSFVEFFSYTGPLQESVRYLGGYENARQYWFPEIRGVGGGVFVMGLVLYPYVFLSVRTLFLLQGSSMIDSARMLGASKSKLFFKILLPLSRPAIVLGVILALMEVMNDIGAVEYLGIQTLTFSIFSIWLNQNDLAGAAQISIILLFLVIIMLVIENKSRGARQYHLKKDGVGDQEISKVNLKGYSGALASICCFLPLFLGFGIPVFVLGTYALDYASSEALFAVLPALLTSFTYGVIATVLTLIIATFLAYSLRMNKSKRLSILVRIASSGYVVPGTLIALGVFIPLSMFDNYFDGLMRDWFNVSTGLLITGSSFALILAYIIRFMGMAEGGLENGMSKISTNLDDAARSLGRSRGRILRVILLPLLYPAIAGAALLVFVDVIKELSATIMLRPFGAQTLATHVYDYASQSRIEEASLACLLIIVLGMVPVLLLSRTAK